MSEEEKMDALNELLDSLPPFPKVVYEWQEEDERIKFQVSEDSVENMKQKLYKVWVMWADIARNKELEAMLSAPPEDVESEEFKVKAVLAHVIDKIAKILTQGDLIKELLT